MGFKQMPLALRVPDLSDAQKLVLLTITDHANEEHGNSTFVGQGRMALELGKARETVNRAVKALCEKGYITREHNYRTTADGRPYMTSSTITVHYEVMQTAVDKAVDNSVDNEGDPLQKTAPPSDPESLPLVTQDHPPSDVASLPLVTTDHYPRDTESQRNWEVNREVEQGNQFGREILSFATKASFGGESNDTNDPRYKATRDAIQDAADIEDDSPFIDALETYFEDGEQMAGEFLNNWHLPSHCADPYKAGKWLSTFLNTMRSKHGLETSFTTPEGQAA